MPTTTDFSFGDVVLVPFPFTDQSAVKKRPAVIVSSGTYQQDGPDVILMAVTSQERPPTAFGELRIQQWSEAGLLKPSILKPLIATVEKALVLRKLGRLADPDLDLLRKCLRQILGD